MRIFSTSSSSPKPNFTLFSPSQNPKKPCFKSFRPFKTRIFLSFPPCSATNSPSVPVLDQETDRQIPSESEKDTFKKVLVVRRPAMDVPIEEEDDQEDDGNDGVSKPSGIDAGLENIAKKMPIFEPEEASSPVVFKRSRLRRWEIICSIGEDIEQAIKKGGSESDGKYKTGERTFRCGHCCRQKHIAAWHGWAVLELKQGNVKKARHLLAKARYLFRQATKCNLKSCASWLAWAQLEGQQENNRAARLLFEKAVQASPKNRFAWHVWGVFEANIGDVDMGRKLLKIGHALNPRDPVLLQSLALLEYKHSTANLARVLFRRASELDPRHQPVWIAWGWMEWKEGNISTAKELYQIALSIDSTTESASRCLQAWGVLEQKAGNLSAARRLFRSSLNINSELRNMDDMVSIGGGPRKFCAC
ncbi:hypothetical protein F3Y22_tig00010888pilonHSYRG00048 [Hibiscus syriacus]|uniref:Uncharacterized protein n=1 Tax=Hibiscus syriacus TaxID=106335 RepID=A0A6A3CAK3_HIBSY|nr:hypothetical protein F3Y22_tig00010888pilonHSYRG00048 [Hibiscus syriacus]